MGRLTALKRRLRPEALALSGAVLAFAFVARGFTEAHIHGANAASPCGLACWIAFIGIAATTVSLFMMVWRALR